MAKRVTTIPATINIVTAQPIGKAKKRRVAGYANGFRRTAEQLSGTDGLLFKLYPKPR